MKVSFRALVNLWNSDFALVRDSFVYKSREGDASYAWWGAAYLSKGSM